MGNSNMDLLLKLLWFLQILQIINAHGYDYRHSAEDDASDENCDDSDENCDDSDECGFHVFTPAYPDTFTVNGEKCIFPFISCGMRYSTCAPGRTQPHPWCATSIDYNNFVISWGVCQSSPVCPGGCGNGSCTSPNKCTCSVGYTGYNCNIPVCEGGCNYGYCTKPNECTCSYGYSGPTCNKPICPGGCENGSCTSPNKCICTIGYTGYNCDIPVCNGGCDHGHCTKPNECTCSNGYSGPTCNKRCPDGLFELGGLQRCFKVLNDVRRTWFEANYKCGSLDLHMARPISSAAAIALRKSLLETYGDGTFWLGAKADGAQYVWVDDGTRLSNTDHLRIPGYSGIHTDNHCLALAVNQNSTTMHPNSPYTFGRCIWEYATLCEGAMYEHQHHN